jgi:hypothetical protein
MPPISARMAARVKAFRRFVMGSADPRLPDPPGWRNFRSIIGSGSVT